jgi:formate C-acetyltransferase
MIASPQTLATSTGLPHKLEVRAKSLLRSGADVLVGNLLRLLALQYNTRPALRRLLKGRDGWMDFSVGVATESGSVARSIRFDGGRVTAHKGLRADVDVTLRFVDEDALLFMLQATPNEMLKLLLENKLIAEGSWAYLQLFNYLLARVLGGVHDRAFERTSRRERLERKAKFDPQDPNILAELRARSSYRMQPEARDSGVAHLADPYLADLQLDDFPRLRSFLDEHLARKAEVCIERPQLITEWCRANGFERRADGQPWHPVERQGKLLRHLLEHKRPVLREGDLLPGSTTTNPVAGSVVFPDAQGVMIWGELDSIGKRELIPFELRPETARTLHRDVFPYWARRNFREWHRAEHGDPPCANLAERWVAYFVWKAVGISHTVPSFERVLGQGTGAVIEELLERARACGPVEPGRDADELERGVTYRAMVDCLEGVNAYAAHLAAHVSGLAAQERDPARAAELREIAGICARVPRKPARTLHEALTAIWIVWVALHNENADTGLSLGRLDQVLQPYFAADMRALDDEAARDAYVRHAVELTGMFFMRCTDHFPLSPDIGNYLFGGASSTQALTLGGVDADGRDAVNDMTYVLLKVTEMLSIRDVNVNARYKTGVNSSAYLKRLCEVNFITAGTPSMHSDDAVFASLAPHGYPERDIRDWSVTGCVEPSLTGKHMGHTGSILMNLVAGMEMALNDGYHPLIRAQVGPHTGRVEDDAFATFEDFFAAYAAQQRRLIDMATGLNNRMAAVHAEHRPTPLLSALMGGTLESGRDVTRGGAEYNSSGTSNIGLADVTDSLLVVKRLVFDEQRVRFSELKRALAVDFEGYPAIRALAQRRVPLFGSGDPDAVAMANRVAGLIHGIYAGLRNYRGGPYTCGFWSMSQHVAYGNLSGALPSGRLAGKSFTPGLTPQPHASKSFLDNIRDVASLAPEHIDNNLAFNVKLVPDPGDTREETVSTMSAYVKSYFEAGGMQMQFNVVTPDMLRDAMAHPENYRGLLVRISGYNAYFVTLNRQIQLELIERAEFGL